MKNYNNQSLKRGWKNTNNDNAHTNKRQEDDTPKTLRRDGKTKTETPRAMEKDMRRYKKTRTRKQTNTEREWK